MKPIVARKIRFTDMRGVLFVNPDQKGLGVSNVIVYGRRSRSGEVILNHRFRDHPNWQENIAASNHAYNAAAEFMETRQLPPDDKGVRWTSRVIEEAGNVLKQIRRGGKQT